MTIGSGSLSRTIAVRENTPGTTPSTVAAGDTLIIPYTSLNANQSSDALDDASITGTRQKATMGLGLKRVTGDMSVNLSEGHDLFIESVLGSAFAGNTVKVGNDTVAFTLENGEVSENLYRQFIGMQVTSWSLDAALESYITSSFSLLGRSQTKGTTSIDSAPTKKSQAETTPFYHDGSGQIKIDGVNVGQITAFNMTVNANLESNYGYGSSIAFDQTTNKLGIDGSVTAFFDSFSLMDKYLNSETSEIIVPMSNGNKTYTTTIPAAKWMGSELSVSENTLSVSMPWTALYSDTLGTSIQIVKS